MHTTILLRFESYALLLIDHLKKTTTGPTSRVNYETSTGRGRLQRMRRHTVSTSHRRLELSDKERLHLFHKTTVSPIEALQYDDDQITFDMMLNTSATWANCYNANVGPAQLKARGAESAADLLKLGFDALHLIDEDFCNECIMTYGSDMVRDAFICTPRDAVSVAGEASMHMLHVTPHFLLAKCAGRPVEAFAVLQQLRTVEADACLEGVPASVIVECGLTANQLLSFGYGRRKMVEHTDPSLEELQELGFSI